MRRTLVIFTTVLGLACGGATHPAEPVAVPEPPKTEAAPTLVSGTLCYEGEEALLKCGTASGKQVGLCLKGETLRFRYGTPGVVLVEHPSADQAPQDAFAWEATVTHGGMGRPPGANDSTLSFARDGASYALHEYVTTGTPAIELKVTGKDGAVEAAACDQDVDGNLVYVAGRVYLPLEEVP